MKLEYIIYYCRHLPGYLFKGTSYMYIITKKYVRGRDPQRDTMNNFPAHIYTA